MSCKLKTCSTAVTPAGQCEKPGWELYAEITYPPLSDCDPCIGTSLAQPSHEDVSAESGNSTIYNNDIEIESCNNWQFTQQSCLKRG